MTREEIWQFAEEKAIGERKIMRRFLKLKPEHASVIKPYLKKTPHPLNHYRTNYRYPSLWHHLHATEHQGQFEIHQDFINPSIYPLLTIIPHAIVEGIPYLVCKAYVSLFDRKQLPRAAR